LTIPILEKRVRNEGLHEKREGQTISWYCPFSGQLLRSLKGGVLFCCTAAVMKEKLFLIFLSVHLSRPERSKGNRELERTDFKKLSESDRRVDICAGCPGPPRQIFITGHSRPIPVHLSCLVFLFLSTLNHIVLFPRPPHKTNFLMQISEYKQTIRKGLWAEYIVTTLELVPFVVYIYIYFAQI